MIGKDWFQLLESLVPRTENLWFHGWEALVRMLGKPAVPRTGSPWFQGWEALIQAFGNQQFLELGTRGSKIGKHWLQLLRAIVSCSSQEPVVPRFGRIGSNVWEPAPPRTGNPWFQDWEALVTTFAGHHQLLQPGARGSKIGKDWFERLGTSTSSNWEPGFQDWEALVPTFGNQRFLELGPLGSKIGKHWVERLGVSSSSNWEPVVPTLGRIGYNVWEPLVPSTGNPWFEDWEA